MEINVSYGYRGRDVQDALDVEELARQVLAAEDVPASAEASITFVDNERIHGLNREFRGVDRPTDVLSFECDGFDDDFDDLPDDAEAPFQLGDVIVAVDVAEAQAPEYAMELPDELSLLVTHGLLHLCGYDHLEEAEAQAMERREQELLEAFWGRPFKRHSLDG